MIWELRSIEWSDYPQLTESEVLASCEAGSEVEAAIHFRKYGYRHGYIGQQGSGLSRDLTLVATEPFDQWTREWLAGKAPAPPIIP